MLDEAVQVFIDMIIRRTPIFSSQGEAIIDNILWKVVVGITQATRRSEATVAVKREEILVWSGEMFNDREVAPETFRSVTTYHIKV